MEWIQEAEQRIRPHIVETPLTWDAKHQIYIKWESHQVTGSFKARGALNKVLSLTGKERQTGLVAVSAGNHGQGVALAAQLTGSSVEVFVPAHAAPSKIEAMKSLGAQVHLVQGGYGAAEVEGRKQAAASGKAFVSPYNDGQVIAGQGTVALECLRQLANMDENAAVACWVVPVGGGGLVSGCGAALSAISSRPRLVGVQAAASPFAFNLYSRHTQDGVQDNPTIAEGLAGEVELDSVTIPMMGRYVDDMLLVSEDEIRNAVAVSWRAYHEKIEGSAAAALGVLVEEKVTARPALVVITGGNIEPELHQSIMAESHPDTWA